jgi:hypothetical protein
MHGKCGNIIYYGNYHFTSHIMNDQGITYYLVFFSLSNHFGHNFVFCFLPGRLQRGEDPARTTRVNVIPPFPPLPPPPSRQNLQNAFFERFPYRFDLRLFQTPTKVVDVRKHTILVFFILVVYA